ncbi:MAG TPA: hypothetical protein PKA10_07420 [Selenomonadales bacterium]|nr:hypothetical protein [Selenomonadales bacterium]
MFLSSIRMPQLCLGAVTIVFVIIWLTAWTLNALKNTHFDLNSLKDMYIWLMTQMNATHAINSIWNSPRGNLPLEGGGR